MLSVIWSCILLKPTGKLSQRRKIPPTSLSMPEDSAWNVEIVPLMVPGLQKELWNESTLLLIALVLSENLRLTLTLKDIGNFRSKRQSRKHKCNLLMTNLSKCEMWGPTTSEVLCWGMTKSEVGVTQNDTTRKNNMSMSKSSSLVWCWCKFSCPPHVLQPYAILPRSTKDESKKLKLQLSQKHPKAKDSLRMC